MPSAASTASSTSARSDLRPVRVSTEPAPGGSCSGVWLTLTPIPSTTAPSRASARIPATFRRRSITSLGHLICTARPVRPSRASATATPATSASWGNLRSGGGFKRTDERIAVPGGAYHLCPNRPRPAVWNSATATAPSGIVGSSRLCVDSVDSTSIRGSPSITSVDSAPPARVSFQYLVPARGTLSLQYLVFRRLAQPPGLGLRIRPPVHTLVRVPGTGADHTLVPVPGTGSTRDGSVDTRSTRTAETLYSGVPMSG